MVAVNLIFDPVKSSALATALAGTTGVDGTNHAVDVPGAAAGDGSALIAVWTLDLGGCTPDDVVSVSADATFSRDLTPAVSDPGEFGAAMFIGAAMTFAPFGAYTATAGDAGVFPGSPDVGSAGFEINGGTPLPLPTATQQIAGSWANGSPGLPQLELLAIVDGRDSVVPGTSGAWSDLTKPTVDVTFAPGAGCFAAADPIPVNNTASSTVGTPSVVDVSLNDNNTPCDPLPGCAIYNTTVIIEPGSTAGGITASVDSAGVATVNATSAGTAIVTIESGCSPSCDPLGADVTVWVPQTLTVTFSEPAGPCETVNAIYDPAASAFFAGFFAGTAGGPGGPTGQGSQGPTISVYQVDAPSVCVATIASVQVQSTVTASPGFDPTNDLLAVAVLSDLSTFTIWGTPTAVSGQANITFPGSVSSGYTSGGGTLVPLIDATWSGGPATSPIYVVVVADASESAPGESIAGSAPILCVEFGDPDCPPASNPKPSDVVKLCVAAAPQAGCATFGGTPSPTLFVAVSGPDGNVIPANSTSYPSNSVGGSDGSGYIRSYYTTTSGLVVTPDAGTWTPGSCGADARQLPAGAVSIADGVYAATLGPNGSNWFPPAGLKSVTVYARHAATNDDATAGGSPGRVEVFVNSNVFMLLDGESFTWSVDDPDSLTTISEVRCEADAAAAIVWVAG